MSSSLELDADGFTQIVDLDVPRVDLVDKAANGTKFLLMKSEDPDAGLLDTDTVRALAKSTTDQEESPVSDPIIKDDLDPTEALVGDSPAAQTPSSPEWEQVDADTAKKFINILNFAQYAVTELAGREAQEGVAGADDGWDNQWNLEDAACAIQYAIDTLAVYAAGEEGDIAIAEEVAKALAPLTDLDLPDVQSAVAIRKSGRVLSTKNEALIRDAAERLTKVLDSLPAAPEEEIMTKNENIEPEAEVEKTEAEVTEPEPVVKDDAAPADGGDDDGDQLVVVFDSNKNILGVVPESAIQPVKGAAAPEAEAPAEAPAAAAAEDTAAAPKADAGVAADVAKGEEPSSEGDFTKELAELRQLVKSQGEEIEFLKSPARPRVALNGVTPKGPLPIPEHDRQSGSDDLAKASALSDEEITDLKKTAMHGATPQERQEAAERLTQATTNTWQDVRAYVTGRR